MLKRVEDRKVDAATANIIITSEREQTLDFSQPIFDAGLQVMVRSTGSSVGLVGAIFNWEMLGLVVFAGLLLFAIANLMWLFERRSQPYFDYTPTRKASGGRSGGRSMSFSTVASRSVCPRPAEAASSPCSW